MIIKMASRYLDALEMVLPHFKIVDAKVEYDSVVVNYKFHFNHHNHSYKNSEFKRKAHALENALTSIREFSDSYFFLDELQEIFDSPEADEYEYEVEAGEEILNHYKDDPRLKGFHEVFEKLDSFVSKERQEELVLESKNIEAERIIRNHLKNAVNKLKSTNLTQEDIFRFLNEEFIKRIHEE